MPRPMEQSPRMTRGEIIFGWVYLPFYLIINAILIYLALPLLGLKGDLYSINLAYFYLNFFAVVIGFRRFLGESLRQTKLLVLIQTVLISYGIYYLLSILVVTLEGILPSFSNPAHETTTEMVSQKTGVMTVCAVLLGPLVEEVLMRGLIFAPLARRNRALAYVISTLVFSALHLWDYVGVAPMQEVMLSLLNYVPASIALAYAYERSRSIWTPIALHMLLNAISVWVISSLTQLL